VYHFPHNNSTEERPEMKDANKLLRRQIDKTKVEHYFLEKKLPKIKPQKKPKYRDKFIQESIEEYIDPDELNKELD
jgi:hypothetical protein